MNTATVTDAPLHEWRPLFWEPVDGTGERLMVGVLHRYDGRPGVARIIRDDVLDCLYGKSAAGARKLIDTGLEMLLAMAETAPLEALGTPVLGLHPGEPRRTAARSSGELLHTAALLYSSLASLDKLDELEPGDAPQQEDVNRRFSTEVRDAVISERPDLAGGFGKGGTLVEGGQHVRFGYFSPLVVLHFTVLHPVRQGASIRDARARLFELQRARTMADIKRAALIAAVPRADDPTLGAKQHEGLKASRIEIEREADSVGMRWHPFTSVADAAEKVIELATA